MNFNIDLPLFDKVTADNLPFFENNDGRRRGGAARGALAERTGYAIVILKLFLQVTSALSVPNRKPSPSVGPSVR